MEAAPVQRFYRYHAAVYDLTRWTLLFGRRAAVEALQLRPDSRVLEIGCGTGLNFDHTVRRLDPNKGTLTGLDFSEHMLVRARRRIARHGWGNVSLVNGDASQLDLPDRFDRVLFGYSLSMIPAWEASLERAAAHLEPGGRLVVLDFGRFEKWGPFGSVMREFLRLNHVTTERDVGQAMKAVVDRVTVRHALGGHHIIAQGVKQVHV